MGPISPAQAIPARAGPTTALTILAYPLETLPPEILQELMAGAVAKVNEAGALLVGGHSIDDDTLKLGFSVTGLGHPDRLWSNRGARVGDVLVLTKAVGTGTLTGAVKNDELRYEDISEAYYVLRHVMFNCKSGVEVRSPFPAAKRVRHAPPNVGLPLWLCSDKLLN